MGVKFDCLINDSFKKLNTIDMHIIKYIRENQKSCKEISIRELSNLCNVSSATILRTAQKLGFSGFSELKYFLKNDLENYNYEQLDTISLLKQDIEQTMKMFEHLSSNYLQDIYELINNADNIYAFGTGMGQRTMIQEFSRCLLNVNKYVVSIPATGELKIISNNIKQSDVIIIVSYSGNIDKYRDSLMNLQVANVPIISITNLSNNELSSLARYNLYFQNSFKDIQFNNTHSSYLTLHLVLHLLYDGYVHYLNNKDH
ncbi:MurR/RpiR family transcriptional regulator [Floccifex sp.]|uniref:MurR/RpiR family transcriptional regulator n=1 Tax=Floccifex sp. TaxID=2815810 RepID=UPI002A748772|nr:MurR/RpiR family transcriptional regulator [Floccifex sp.]MDD7281921.1 MurR/RpiR family transcriptional regulator [Erysipelotrichaceae bacterium]MDY2958131.1 MurR/RpiR family transcriptional regulator [Floccifex sp.]